MKENRTSLSYRFYSVISAAYLGAPLRDLWDAREFGPASWGIPLILRSQKIADVLTIPEMSMRMTNIDPIIENILSSSKLLINS